MYNQQIQPDPRQRRRFWEAAWWAGAFIDAGNAFDSSDFEVRYGYGGGARWYSPVGRLRLDLAFPDDREQDDWRIHFSLGADL